ncbi:MAG TPA: arsenate reductase [Nitrospiraceae bacterium]|nr:MAG: arsenate reductase [Nitrospirae bacterium GWC1_57_7]OGW46248.1 MAG: arsenate reductase [Nitrospirae bacterium GWD2_57_8]HAR46468.1 arsenate reductase [Nitrospiraceae bacterium]HAS53716.1 arsenate reductase [Nitrospiraceae bacterium]
MFLCTGNSCRSQMAEGLARELGKGKIEAYSAGLAPSQVNPYAVRVMQEIGIDISRQTSKAINQDLILKMDVVITLCGHAEVLCPMTPPQVKRLHWPIDDPILATGTENEVLLEFRRARDQIRENLRSFMGK